MNDSNEGIIGSLASESITKQVLNYLTYKIINNDFKIGEYLPTEEALCKDLQIGRSSVREAIKVLETRGLVKKLRGKGVIVIDDSISAASEMLRIVLAQKKATISNLLEFRNAMEVKMAGLAAVHATQEDLDNLEYHLNLMKDKEYSVEAFAKYDYDFHKAIASATRNNIFVLMMETMQSMLYDQIAYTLDSNFNPELSMHYYESIFEAIKSGDPKIAKKAMTEHLSGTKVSIYDKGDYVPEYKF